MRVVRWSKILAGARQNAEGVRFSDLVGLVEAMGYTERRQKGSHRIFTRPGAPMINLQEEKGKAKKYQVEQVLKILDALKLEVE
jgi:predicted RNA binding protein YcfA (HicA-like mRNA interferase family)